MEERQINAISLEIVQGDITREETDAIVNAANSRLAGGGGVDGAIHRAGGPNIMEECLKIGGCPTGTAVITTAGNLKAKKVIHTVGPIYRGGDKMEAQLLKNAYWSSLDLARENGLNSVAFPAISTGVYGYPLEEAAEIAVGAGVEYAGIFDQPMLIRFVLFDSTAYKAFSRALKTCCI